MNYNLHLFLGHFSFFNSQQREHISLADQITKYIVIGLNFSTCLVKQSLNNLTNELHSLRMEIIMSVVICFFNVHLR